MRLSEAIRAGAQQYPQTFGLNFECRNDGHIVGCCAIGAALVAVYPLLQEGEFHRRSFSDLEQPLNIDISQQTEHPATHLRDTLFNVIVDLNDVHRWSREDIAAWLASIGY